jgi:hypothetical protein
VTWLRIVVGVGLGVSMLSFFSANSCDVATAVLGGNAYQCPWDHRMLLVGFVTLGVTTVAATILVAWWVTDRRKRAAADAATRADIEQWRHHNSRTSTSAR